MNADHTKAQNIKECEVVSMVGFGSYHCILEDKDGNEEARIIHGKDLIGLEIIGWKFKDHTELM